MIIITFFILVLLGKNFQVYYYINNNILKKCYFHLITSWNLDHCKRLTQILNII